ncbi:unnamed protein product, partial [Didymodactylos carnosus]
DPVGRAVSPQNNTECVNATVKAMNPSSNMSDLNTVQEEIIEIDSTAVFTPKHFYANAGRTKYTFPSSGSISSFNKLDTIIFELSDNEHCSSTPVIPRRFSERSHRTAASISKTHNNNSFIDDLPVPNTSNSSGLVIYESPFDELCDWLTDILSTGTIVSMTAIQKKYTEILNFRNKTITESIVRSLYIRKRLENRFPNLLHFETPSDKDGTYVSYNNLSSYIQLSTSKSKESSYSAVKTSSCNEKPCDQKDSGSVFDGIRIIRDYIIIGHHTLKTFGN